MRIANRARAVAWLGVALCATAIVAVMVLWESKPARAPEVTIGAELVTFESHTGEWDDIRTGRFRSRPVTVSASLYMPNGAEGPVPGAVLLHGSDGIADVQVRYARALADAGIAALVVDSFGPRGVSDTIGDQRAVSAYTMTIDAYGALKVLAADLRIDAARIAVIGWSKGGLAADFASRTWYQVHLSSSGLTFAAHAAFYSWCGEQPAKPQQTGAPLLYLLGELDDWTGSTPCLRYAERLADAGYQARAVVYAGALHGFDYDGRFSRFVPAATNLSNCVYLFEKDGFRDLASGRKRDWSAFDLYLEDCAKAGAHTGSNAAARAAAWLELLSFLRGALGG